ncbi:MAG TPA: hypothetical protein VFU23_05595 [Gemmatimonadales bacterium]|nr:hypothetical protein [Gemmatimonadales bacterium]
MMFPSFFSHVGIAVLAAAGAPGPTHAWIADIKAQRSTLLGKEVRLEGEVVDVRSTSPTVKRGLYRLTDASDPLGVLVRTERVPIEGGSFRLRARVAEDQSVIGTLLLDELDRDRTDARPLLPVIAVAGFGVGLALIGFLFWKAYVEERRFAVAPPLWLMPEAGPYGKAGPASGPLLPPLKYDPDLEEADRAQREQLQRRKRGLLQAMAGLVVLTGSSAAWVINTRPVAGQVPAFIFIDSGDPSVPSTQAATIDTTIRGDSALTRPQPTGPLPAPDRHGTTAQVVMPARTRPADPPPGTRSTPLDTVTRIVVAPPPAPSPSPAPAPAPPPPPPPPEPAAPARDPAADRALAQARISEAASRLVAAINARRTSDVALMLPESMAGDAGRRDRFLKLIKDMGPKATLGGVEETIVAEDRGEARMTIAFAWRGDFGVDKKKTARLLAVARRLGEAWQFEGARLLDAVP